MRTDTPHTIMIIPHRHASHCRAIVRGVRDEQNGGGRECGEPKVEVQCQRANNPRGEDDYRQLLRELQWFWGLTLV